MDSVAVNSVPATAFTPTKPTNPLTVVLSNSVTTLTSSYSFSLRSDRVPVDSPLTLSLSSMHTINGGCFAVEDSAKFTGVLNCTVVNSTTVRVTITGDTTPMMTETINYSITLTNVTNPATVQPLTYSLTTLFNGQSSQLYTSVYSIANPLPLSFTYSRSNSTYAQPATLTLALTSAYSTFD